MPASRRTIQTVIRNLKRRNARRRESTVLLEGVRLVEEALAAGVTLAGAVVSPTLERTERGRDLLEGLDAAGIRIERITDRELRALADTDSPQGVVAVAEPGSWSLSDIDVAPTGRFLVLDQVQDPGNVGTIIRTAHALGAAGVILLPGSALPTHPKVLRAAMGSTFRVPVVRVSAEEVLAWLIRHHVEIWVADRAGESVQGVPTAELLALVVGNEGAGVSEAWRQAAVRTVSVPMQSEVESLNAAAAAAILLYEVSRDS